MNYYLRIKTLVIFLISNFLFDNFNKYIAKIMNERHFIFSLYYKKYLLEI
jgi:hypothetical protein